MKPNFLGLIVFISCLFNSPLLFAQSPTDAQPANLPAPAQPTPVPGQPPAGSPGPTPQQLQQLQQLQQPPVQGKVQNMNDDDNEDEEAKMKVIDPYGNLKIVPKQTEQKNNNPIPPSPMPQDVPPPDSTSGMMQNAPITSTPSNPPSPPPSQPAPAITPGVMNPPMPNQ